VNFWKVILVTLVIFSTGVITGSMAARKTAAKALENSPQPTSAPRLNSGFQPDRRLRMDFITKVQEQLHLTPLQLEEIEVIVTEGQTKMCKLWEEFSPQMRGEFDATQDRLREVLTADQREQFEELIKKRRSSRHGDRTKHRGRTNAAADAVPTTNP